MGAGQVRTTHKTETTHSEGKKIAIPGIRTEWRPRINERTGKAVWRLFDKDRNLMLDEVQETTQYMKSPEYVRVLAEYDEESPTSEHSDLGAHTDTRRLAELPAGNPPVSTEAVAHTTGLSILSVIAVGLILTVVVCATRFIRYSQYLQKRKEARTNRE